MEYSNHCHGLKLQQMLPFELRKEEEGKFFQKNKKRIRKVKKEKEKVAQLNFQVGFESAIDHHRMCNNTKE